MVYNYLRTYLQTPYGYQVLGYQIQICNPLRDFHTQPCEWKKRIIKSCDKMDYEVLLCWFLERVAIDQFVRRVAPRPGSTHIEGNLHIAWGTRKKWGSFVCYIII